MKRIPVSITAVAMLMCGCRTQRPYDSEIWYYNDVAPAGYYYYSDDYYWHSNPPPPEYHHWNLLHAPGRGGEWSRPNDRKPPKGRVRRVDKPEGGNEKKPDRGVLKPPANRPSDKKPVFYRKPNAGGLSAPGKRQAVGSRPAAGGKSPSRNGGRHSSRGGDQ